MEQGKTAKQGVKYLLCVFKAGVQPQRDPQEGRGGNRWLGCSGGICHRALSCSTTCPPWLGPATAVSQDLGDLKIVFHNSFLPLFSSSSSSSHIAVMLLTAQLSLKILPGQHDSTIIFYHEQFPCPTKQFPPLCHRGHVALAWTKQPCNIHRLQTHGVNTARPKAPQEGQEPALGFSFPLFSLGITLPCWAHFQGCPQGKVTQASALPIDTGFMAPYHCLAHSSSPCFTVTCHHPQCQLRREGSFYHNPKRERTAS